MRSPQRRRQGGFTLIEIIVSVAIIGVLGSISLAQVRDYTRRAKISELVMAVTKCKNTVAENYLTLESAPEAGTWGCESRTPVSPYSGAVQTSADGAIRISISNLDRLVNGQHVYLVPVRSDGTTPMNTTIDLGRPVRHWACGSDWQPVRNSLPSNCRTDTTAIAAGSDFN
jgi:type IV pilus assembly protein PilA